jgi:hypothetical protein
MGFDTLSGNAAPSKFIGSLRKKVESFSDNELGGFGSLVLIDGDVGVCRCERESGSFANATETP